MTRSPRTRLTELWQRVWEGLRPLDPYRSVKAALGALVSVSVIITTLLVFVAMHSATELRVITIFSIIASLLITQFVANSLTAPLDEMTDVTRSMAHGNYSRRVRSGRRDEFGDLANAFNRMAADLEAVDTHRKELVANVSHELRTPIAALRAVLENVVDGVCEPDPETMRTALKQTERLGGWSSTSGPVPAGQRGGAAALPPLRGLAVSVRGAQGSQYEPGRRDPRRGGRPGPTPVRTSICTWTSRRRS